MTTTAAETFTTCKNCNTACNGKHCYQCGQKLSTGRITLHSLLHEVFHYFTHVDKGFGYTLKQLIVRPGAMQKEFVEGKRSAHQKPFSMFFLCGTIAGLGYYFINVFYQKMYDRNTEAEADFFRHYFILLQAVMLPVYTFILWVLFKNSKKNYAELLVLSLYTVSIVFLVFILINALKLVFPDFENRYLELAFIFFYNSMTNVYFFAENKWIVIGKTVVMLLASYAISQAMNELVMAIVT
jgi:hypothetical protein